MHDFRLSVIRPNGSCKSNYALFGLVVGVGHPCGVKEAMHVNIQEVRSLSLSRDDGGGGWGWVAVVGGDGWGCGGCGMGVGDGDRGMVG